MTRCLWFTEKRIKKLIVIGYLLLAGFLALNYWVFSPKPILSPVLALAQSFFGDVYELPLGESWTSKYTQRVTISNGAGLIGKNCVIFLPFPFQSEHRILELVVRPLFFSPIYKLQATILFNDREMASQNIELDWQTIRFKVRLKRKLTPYHLKIHLNLEPMPELTVNEGQVISVRPGEIGLMVFDGKKWRSEGTEVKAGLFSVKREVNHLIIDGRSHQLGPWPITIALTRLGRDLDNPALAAQPLLACQMIRLR